jgi:two-component system, OmpR family, sensor histidine kinase KdpD
VTDQRPNPDQLLARVQREEEKSRRGRLKVFFGASAGVGKTYAMLAAAHAEQDAGKEVVVGLVETHGRRETAAFLEGLELLPRLRLDRDGVGIEEFDLDAALARHPGLLLVDELAHTNAAGSRHPKRWQDIEELRDAGIDIFTTLNVQHLESLNDIVGQVTGVRVFETLPDKVFDGADEVELVDLPADELLGRLAEGKVYLPEQAKRAAENFFRKGNLIALRELALRRTADRVDAQMRDYREEKGIRAPWPVAERLVVAVGPGPEGENLVRAARRWATAFDAEWTALYVETPPLLKLPEVDRDRVLRTLRMAEELGAKSVVIGGGDVAEEVLGFARAQNASRIVVGRTKGAQWRLRSGLSTSARIVARADDIDVSVIGSESRTTILGFTGDLLARSRAHLGVSRPERQRWHRYALGAAAVAACTGAGALMFGRFQPANIVMVYLVGVMVAALWLGRGPSALTAVLSVLTFDFFFVPPYLSFAVSDTEYLITFAVMLVVGLVISTLVARVRLQARIAGHREARAIALADMSAELAATDRFEDLLRIGVRHVATVFSSQVALLLPDPSGRIRRPSGPGEAGSLHGADTGIAQWVFDHQQPAGLGTDTLAGTDTLYLPLAIGERAVGVLALLPANARRVFVPEQRRLLQGFASQVAVALQRAQLAEKARASQMAAETESVRNALLAAISHELRTPLAAIVGASSTLASSGNSLSPDSRRELAASISEESRHMSEVVAKVLDLARLQSGAARVQRDWHPVEEIVGSALARLRDRLARHKIATLLPPPPALVHVDAVLLEQVVANLLENAAKYTPPGTSIEIRAAIDDGIFALVVHDEGPGIKHGEEERVFEKFHRSRPEAGPGGAGLGLAICRAVVEAHGGRITSENSAGGGATFRVEIPQPDEAPRVDAESLEAGPA